MMRCRSVVLLISILLLFSVPAWGQAPLWQFDPPHSSFRFAVKHIYSTIWGHFDTYSGEVRFDPENLSESSFTFTIDVASIQTNVGKRDNHLRSKDFFDVKNYPHITFESASIKHIDGELYAVDGMLTMKDISKKVTLPLLFHGIKAHPMSKGKMVAGFDITTTLNRLDYHVGSGMFHEMGVVDKNVKIVVSLEMLRDKP